MALKEMAPKEMTVKELKEILANYDDDAVVRIKDDYGEFSMVEGYHDDTEEYWETYEDYKAKKPVKIRKVLKFY